MTLTELVSESPRSLFSFVCVVCILQPGVQNFTFYCLSSAVLFPWEDSCSLYFVHKIASWVWQASMSLQVQKSGSFFLLHFAYYLIVEQENSKNCYHRKSGSTRILIFYGYFNRSAASSYRVGLGLKCGHVNAEEGVD
ncbi:hypothetical protein V6N13_083507 [Hibiscus sabdariffa]